MLYLQVTFSNSNLVKKLEEGRITKRKANQSVYIITTMTRFSSQRATVSWFPNFGKSLRPRELFYKSRNLRNIS